MDRDNSMKVSFRIPTELVVELDDECERLNSDPAQIAVVTRTDVAVLAIKTGLAALRKRRSP